MKEVPLSHFVRALESGSRPPGGIREGVGDIPSLGAEHLTDDGGFNLSKLKLVPKEFFSSIRAGRIKDGDILIVKDGATTGKTSFVNELFPFEEAAINEHVFRMEIDCNLGDPSFIFRFLSSPMGKMSILKDFRGATVGGIGRSFIEKVMLPDIELNDQRRIAAILDKADAIRRRRRQALAEIDNLLRATFLDMFGDPVRNTKQLPRAQLADFEENLTSGSRGWAKHYAAQGNVFIRIGNVGRDRLLLEDLVYVKAPENAEAQRTRVRPGDLLISITADLGRTAVIPSGFPTAYINQHLASIRLRGLSPTYTSAFLSSRGGQRQFDRLDRTGVKSGLNFDDIRSLEILIPDPKEQASYEAFVQRLHEYSGQAASEAAQAERLFQSLSNRAFRGEL